MLPPASQDAMLAALLARIEELEKAKGTPVAAPATASMPLAADPALVERIKVATAAPKEDSRRAVLPPLQPGHKVNPLSLRKCFTFSYTPRTPLLCRGLLAHLSGQ